MSESMAIQQEEKVRAGVWLIAVFMVLVALGMLGWRKFEQAAEHGAWVAKLKGWKAQSEKAFAEQNYEEALKYATMLLAEANKNADMLKIKEACETKLALKVIRELLAAGRFAEAKEKVEDSRFSGDQDAGQLKAIAEIGIYIDSRIGVARAAEERMELESALAAYSEILDSYNTQVAALSAIPRMAAAAEAATRGKARMNQLIEVRDRREQLLQGAAERCKIEDYEGEIRKLEEVLRMTPEDKTVAALLEAARACRDITSRRLDADRAREALEKKIPQGDRHYRAARSFVLVLESQAKRDELKREALRLYARGEVDRALGIMDEIYSMDRDVRQLREEVLRIKGNLRDAETARQRNDPVREAASLRQVVDREDRVKHRALYDQAEERIKAIVAEVDDRYLAKVETARRAWEDYQRAGGLPSAVLTDISSGVTFGAQNEHLKAAFREAGEAAQLVLDYKLGNRLEAEDIYAKVKAETEQHYWVLFDYADNLIQRMGEKTKGMNVLRRLLTLPEVPGNSIRQQAEERIKKG